MELLDKTAKFHAEAINTASKNTRITTRINLINNPLWILGLLAERKSGFKLSIEMLPETISILFLHITAKLTTKNISYDFMVYAKSIFLKVLITSVYSLKKSNTYVFTVTYSGKYCHHQYLKTQV